MPRSASRSSSPVLTHTAPVTKLQCLSLTAVAGHGALRHRAAAWAGFDLMMAVGAIATVVGILRGSRYVAMAASVTATFLVSDAWFDLITSRPGSELFESTVFAVFGELPMAALCLWIARDAEKVCAQTSAYLERRRAPA